ncbi:MAG: DUF5060 domain-containing protein [Crocinitomicaceae bacterium]|nr:MAG: DUF5060 domain-containing protein [Crocinitomicaceae bacterium]
MRLVVFLLSLLFSNVVTPIVAQEFTDFGYYRVDKHGEPGQIEKYKRLEYAFKLPSVLTTRIDNFFVGAKSGINPFDPEQIDFRVHFYAPNGEKTTCFGFYYQAYKPIVRTAGLAPSNYINEYQSDTTHFPWRVRFAPDQEGTWKLDVEIIQGTNTYQLVKEEKIECIPSNHKGYLAISSTGTEQDRWMYYSETKEPFFAISNNISSGGGCTYLPSQVNRQVKGLRELIEVGGNFTRFELGGQAALPDWPVYDNYSGKMDEMMGFDRLLDECENNGVYFTLFRHHVEVMDLNDWDPCKWSTNPYRIAFDLQSVEEYFTNEEVLKWQRNNLRYLFARWGYSPNMAFYSYSEVDRWYSKMMADSEDGSDFKDGGTKSETEAASILIKWIADQQEYIYSALNKNTLFVHSHATPFSQEMKKEGGFFELSDVVAVHNYGETKDINYKKRYDQIEKYWDKYHKPILLEEMGPSKIAMYCCTGIEYHNSIWSTAMMGDFGTGMDWWWDGGVHDYGYHRDLKPLSQFFQGVNLRGGNYQPQKWEDNELALDGSEFARKNRLIENYALVSKNQESILGWVHNASFYWRNLVPTNSCMSHLVNNTTSESQPCYFAVDKDGFPRDFNQYSCIPRVYNDVYHHEDLTGFENYTDNFSESGGKEILLKDEINFEISGLKKSTMRMFTSKRNWYKIEFYSTVANDNTTLPVAQFTQYLSTTASGKLKPIAPTMNAEHPDYSYKISFLGYKKESEIKP